MAAYRQVYDSHHLQADCQEPESAPHPTLGNRVLARRFRLPLVRAARRSYMISINTFCYTRLLFIDVTDAVNSMLHWLTDAECMGSLHA